MTWYKLVATPFSLLEDQGQKQQLTRQYQLYSEYAMTMMRIIREQVPGYPESTVYNAYVRFLDDRYRELNASDGAYPTIESSELRGPPELPRVTEAYQYYLLLKDAKVATELAYRKRDNTYNFSFLKDPLAASKDVAKASVDNLSEFRDKMRRHVAVNSNPYLEFDDTAPPGYFYGASLMILDIPDRLKAGQLSDGPRLKYDVLTITTQQQNTGAKRRYTGKVGASEHAETAAARNHVSLRKLEWKYSFLVAAAYFDPVKYEKQKIGMGLMIDALKYQQTNLLLTNAIYTFFENKKSDLDARIYDFVAQMQDMGVSLEWLPDVQNNLYQYGMPAFRFAKSNPCAKQTMGIFYPFKAAEIQHRGPKAVHIGENIDTRTPVIIDIFQGKLDANGWIFGRIGVGKSIIEKHILEEMAKQCKAAGIPLHVVGIEPPEQQEHRHLADRMGIPYLTLEGGAGLGDILNYGAAHTIAVLSKLFELDYELSNLLYPSLEFMASNGRKIKDIEQVLADRKAHIDPHRQSTYSRLTEAIHAKMDEYRYLFEGRPLPKGSFIFNTHSKQRHSKASIAAAYVVTLRALEYFHDPAILAHPKILFVEEAHRLLADPLTRAQLAKAYLEERKFTIGIWCITQEAAHVASSDDTLGMLNNSAWKFVFQTDSAELLQKPLGISDETLDKLKTSNQLNQLRKGFCLVKMDEKQVLCQTRLPKEQLVAYNTDFRQLAPSQT